MAREPVPGAGFRGRFAPSPTGEMHLGNARTALLAWLQAREAGGALILRIEDLDVTRIRPGAEETILQDLAWLGLDWDEGPDVGGLAGPYRQSERLGHYEAAVSRLPTYPCTCTRKEILATIQASASAPHGDEPRYAGTCRTGPTHPARPAALRVRVPEGLVCFSDGLHGRVCRDVQATVGDFAVRRNDGVFAYQLACVVDDFLMGVTDVLRGEDLLESTPRQVMLYDLFKARAPRFCHVPLMTDYRGERLAKRGGAPSIRALRDSGADPRVIVRDLAVSLGWDVPKPCPPRDLIGQFGLWLGSARLQGRPG
jgi:glutamyl-tRNA synthetase